MHVRTAGNATEALVGRQRQPGWELGEAELSRRILAIAVMA